MPDLGTIRPWLMKTSIPCMLQEIHEDVRHHGKKPRLEGSDDRRTNEPGRGSNMLGMGPSKQIENYHQQLFRSQSSETGTHDSPCGKTNEDGGCRHKETDTGQLMNGPTSTWRFIPQLLDMQSTRRKPRSSKVGCTSRGETRTKFAGRRKRQILERCRKPDGQVSFKAVTATPHLSLLVPHAAKHGRSSLGDEKKTNSGTLSKTKWTGVVQSSDGHTSPLPPLIGGQLDPPTEATTGDLFEAGLTLEAHRQRTLCLSMMVCARIQRSRRPWQ